MVRDASAGDSGPMNLPEHPSLSLPVTVPDRDRAEDALKEAYADGRIGEVELDRRLGLVMTATNRRELNGAFYGIAPARPFPPGLPLTARPRGTGLAAVAHFSVFFTWIFGPLLCWAVAGPGSYARREAAKAFNFQVISTVLLVLAGVLGGLVLPTVVDTMLGLGFVAWLVLTVVGGARAASGANWTNPVSRVIRWEVLDASGR